MAHQILESARIISRSFHKTGLSVTVRKKKHVEMNKVAINSSDIETRKNIADNLSVTNQP